MSELDAGKVLKRGGVAKKGKFAWHSASANVEWSTPQDLFDALDSEFRFTLDVCATAENAKCGAFFSPDQDGLSQVWRGVCWMNPPYRGIAAWMRKAYESATAGAVVVCLIRARTDTRWWHEYAMRGEVRFLRGRLSFGDGQGRAPFPSAIVVFRPRQLTLEGE